MFVMQYVSRNMGGQGHWSDSDQQFIWVGKVGKCTGCQLRCTMAGWWFGTFLYIFYFSIYWE